MKNLKITFLAIILLIISSSFGIVDSKRSNFTKKIELKDSTNTNSSELKSSKISYFSVNTENKSKKTESNKSKEQNFNFIEALVVLMMKFIKFIIIKLTSLFI